MFLRYSATQSHDHGHNLIGMIKEFIQTQIMGGVLGLCTGAELLNNCAGFRGTRGRVFWIGRGIVESCV